MRTYKLKKCKTIHGIHFSPDGETLLVISGWEVRGIDTLIWLDRASGQAQSRNDIRADHYVIPQGKSILVAGGFEETQLPGRSDDLALLGWATLPELKDWQPIDVLEKLPGGGSIRPGELFAVATDPQGKLIAAATGYYGPPSGQDSDLHTSLSLLQLGSGASVLTVPETEMIGAIALSPDATRMAVSGGVDGEPDVVMYQLPKGKELWSFDPPGTRTRQLTFAPDGRLAVANARKVYVLPSDQPDNPLELAGHKGQDNTVAFAPDGERLLTASQDGGIRIWNSRSGELLKTFDFGIGAVRAIAFSPDGLTCAAGGEKGQIVVWDVDS